MYGLDGLYGMYGLLYNSDLLTLSVAKIQDSN